ncbi:hypothetical protein HID58_059904, partial [Brassica napus]
LSFSSTEETLTLAFSQYGRVLGDQSLKSQHQPEGFSYVTFSSKEEASEALLELNGQVSNLFFIVFKSSKLFFLSHVRWGIYMMNNCEFPGGVLNHQLSELLVDGRVVIRDTTKVVKQNRPLHIEDPNKILARSVGVVDPSGWRKLKSSPYSAPNTDLALMACSLLILRAEVQCGRTRNQPWSLMRIFNVPQ